MKVNKIRNPYNLTIGIRLCIPGGAENLPENRPAAPGEGTMPLPTPSVPPMRPDNNMPGGNMPQQPACRGTMYTIVAGDTLYMIAKKHRVNLDAIINANPGIDPYNLRIGMKICIPR